MSEAIPTGLTSGDESAVRARTLSVTSRLLLGANTTLQLTMLFGYLYLRANNFGGMWHPDGVSAPPAGLAVAALVAPLVGLLALWAVTSASERAQGAPALTRFLGLAMVAGVVTVGVRILLQYQFGWNLNQGTYVDISTLWYAVVLAEFIIVGLWMLSIFTGHVRGTVVVTRAQARSLAEQWAYTTGIAVGVFLFVQFVS